jgi:alpha 1,6-mannosyltransferase
MLIRPLTLVRIVIPVCALLLLYHYIYQDQEPSPSQDAHSRLPFEISIPKTIHQLLISMPGHPVSSFKPNSHTISWQQSGWKIEYWNEDSCLQLAQELNSTGSYSETFQQLPTAILRSDFCRYVVMFGRGGIYNDLDVHLIRPLPWDIMGPSREDSEGPPGLIIGMEGDASTKGLPRSPQFVQWTIASAPTHPILQNVLDRIADETPSYLNKAAGKDVEIDIMNWTGPSVWTDAVLKYLGCTDEQIQKLRDLKEPLRIKDVLILPKRSFAITQGEDHTSSDILVKHYFSGTWKNCKKGWLARVISWGC